MEGGNPIPIASVSVPERLHPGTPHSLSYLKTKTSILIIVRIVLREPAACGNSHGGGAGLRDGTGG